MTENNEKDRRIKVEIHNEGDNDSEKSEVEKLQEQLEQERTEKEDLQAKLELIAEKEFSIAREKLGAPPEIDTVEKLEAWKLAKGLKSESNPALTTGGGASGKASLFSEPSYRATNPDLGSYEFDSIPHMVSTLKQLANEGDLQAKEYLKQLEQKGFLDKKSCEIVFEKGFGINEFWEKQKQEQAKKQKGEQ